MDMVEVFGILLLKVKVFGIPLLKLLDVLVVPLTVAAAVPFFTWRQRRREEFIGKQRAQDEALQAYLGQMSQLLLDKDRPLLQSRTDSEVQEEEDRQRRSKLSGLPALPSMVGAFSASQGGSREWIARKALAKRAP